MVGRSAISIVTAAALVALAGSLAVGAASTEVKTGQNVGKLQIGKSAAKGQLRTAGGSGKASKLCLKKREVQLKGPAETLFSQPADAAAAVVSLGTDKTNAKGVWSISPSPDMFFGAGLYVVKVKRKTVGGAKQGRQIIRCSANKKKVSRGT